MLHHWADGLAGLDHRNGLAVSQPYVAVGLRREVVAPVPLGGRTALAGDLIGGNANLDPARRVEREHQHDDRA